MKAQATLHAPSASASRHGAKRGGLICAGGKSRGRYFSAFLPPDLWDDGPPKGRSGLDEHTSWASIIPEWSKCPQSGQKRARISKHRARTMPGPLAVGTRLPEALMKCTPLCRRPGFGTRLLASDRQIKRPKATSSLKAKPRVGSRRRLSSLLLASYAGWGCGWARAPGSLHPPTPPRFPRTQF
jgi:hypothetical protein